MIFGTGLCPNSVISSHLFLISSFYSGHFVLIHQTDPHVHNYSDMNFSKEMDGLTNILQN